MRSFSALFPVAVAVALAMPAAHAQQASPWPDDEPWTSSFVMPLASTTILRAPNELAMPLTVICKDRIVQWTSPETINNAATNRPLAKPDDLTVRQKPAQGSRIGPIEYHLPCPALLVLGAGVTGIPHISPWKAPLFIARRTPPNAGSRMTEIEVGDIVARGQLELDGDALHHCEVIFPGEAVPRIKTRICQLIFAADLNQDGKVDFVLQTRGEMGCGGEDLYLSEPSGWRVAASRTFYC